MSENGISILSLLEGMQNENASDLLIAEGKCPSYRVFSEIRPVKAGTELTTAEFDSFINDRLPAGMLQRLQADREIDIGITLDNGTRYRLNICHEQGRRSMVARRVPSGDLDFDELGMPPIVKTFAEAPRGLLLITGATGSGKSTSMAAILHHINTNFKKHIVTIEDPIEFIHRDRKSIVTQREVGSDTPSFSSALKHVVRQSPDVIFLGEIRDLESIQTATSAAMTGHLVVTTMHTVDVTQTLERIINYFPEHLRPQMAMDLSLALTGILSQRLLPRRDGEGLVPVFECLVPTPLIRRVIAERQLEEIAERVKRGTDDGMMTFTRSLADRCGEGLISIEVATAAATNPEEFLLLMDGMQTGIDSIKVDDQEDAPGTLNMRSLLKAAVQNDASDLIISTGVSPVLRVDGDLAELELPRLTGADTRKLLYSILTPAQRLHVEAEKELDFALSVELKTRDGGTLSRRFRVNVFHQKGTIAGAFRVIPIRIPTAEELMLPAVLLDQISRHHGLILITGPTGHGKTTTLACLLNIINETRRCHIITIEDPIEYVHSNKKAVIEQRELFADTHSFANALKYVLRQDPDVILIGEMRDPEAIATALTAAETGHLVLATLHTNDAMQTVDRIVDSFPGHQQNQVRTQLAASLICAVSQRLLPKADGVGRVAAFEVMVATQAIRALIRDERTHQIPATIEASGKDGMITMDKALTRLYQKGVISREMIRALISDTSQL